MSTVDWVLLAIVAISALFGLMRGFVGVLASLAAWVLAGWAAFRFGAEVALMIASDGGPGPGQLLAGYALSFLVVLLAVGLVGWLVRKLVQTVGLSGLDRLLGLLLGVARGAFVACALVLLLGLTELPRKVQWQASPVVPVFVPGAQWMRAWLPAWVAEQVDFRGESTAPALVSRHSIPPVDALPLPLPVSVEAVAETMIQSAAPQPVSSNLPVDAPASAPAIPEQPGL